VSLARIVAFRAAGVACAADPADVERILRPAALLPAPAAPPWIAGLVASPRGLLAVVDVGRRLFPSRQGAPPRDLLAGTFDGLPLALGADEVEGIFPVEAAEPPAGGLPGEAASFLRGAVLAGGQRRLLLDVRRLAAAGGDAARQIVSGAATERRDHSS
jgi:chemotaxis signal transduction protein